MPVLLDRLFISETESMGGDSCAASIDVSIFTLSESIHYSVFID